MMSDEVSAAHGRGVRVGLRWRVMLLLAVISASTAATVGLVSYESMQRRLQTEIDRSLVEAAERFLEGPNGVRRFRAGGRLAVIVPERPLGIEQYVVHVATAGGSVLASTPGATLPVVDASAMRSGGAGRSGALMRTVVSAEGDRYRVRSITAAVPGLRRVVIQVGRDLAETDNVLSDLRTRIVLIGSGVVVIAALVGAAISAGMTSRLTRLSRAAEHIARTGDLSVDLPVEGRDEASSLATSFQRMVEALADSRAQQQRLVQDAGHELRTPLTSLRTNIEVLSRHDDLPGDVVKQILSDLERDIGELGQLVEEIVTTAAEIDPRRSEVEDLERVHLGELVTEVVDRFRRRSGREFRVVSDGSTVEIRRTSIERAVSNLLDNAVKFDSGSEPIDVEVARGRVTVGDRGPGIPGADLERVFGRFFRSDTARSLPGSGLGLSIVADAASGHGGGYFARQRDGGGSEIGFWLPPALD